MKDNLPERKATGSEIVFCRTEDGKTRIEVRLEDNTVWLTQRLIAELFQKDVRTVNEHIGNTYAEGELSREANIREFRKVQTEGPREVARVLELYNLDVILAVGYRVKSHRGTQFRIWATERLREYLGKGFTLDDERSRRAELTWQVSTANMTAPRKETRLCPRF
jgi:hypothetical protein